MHENPVQFLVQNCCDLEQKKWKPYNQANPITTTTAYCYSATVQEMIRVVAALASPKYSS